MQNKHHHWFRQPSNPTQHVKLFEDRGQFSVEHIVHQHKFMDGKTYVIADQTFDHYIDAKGFYDGIVAHLVWLEEQVGNELDPATGEELPDD